MGLYCTPVLVILFVCSCAADSGTHDNGYGNGYSGLTNFLTNLVREAKRSVVTDHGYGSRVNAAARVADALTTYDNVYGVYGPGKRDVLEKDYTVTSNDDDVILGELPKRRYTDMGYGSRMAAGKTIAVAKLMADDIFGDDGPGKRSTEDGRPFKTLNVRSGEMSDAGYLSRISAAKLIARDMDTGYNIFGSSGPGKRR